MSILLLLALWSAERQAALGWVSGAIGSCSYVLLTTGRHIATWESPQPCNLLQVAHLNRTTRNVIYDDQGKAIGYSTVGGT